VFFVLEGGGEIESRLRLGIFLRDWKPVNGQILSSKSLRLRNNQEEVKKISNTALHSHTTRSFRHWGWNQTLPFASSKIST